MQSVAKERPPVPFHFLVLFLVQTSLSSLFPFRPHIFTGVTLIIAAEIARNEAEGVQDSLSLGCSDACIGSVSLSATWWSTWDSS